MTSSYGKQKIIFIKIFFYVYKFLSKKNNFYEKRHEIVKK